MPQIATTFRHRWSLEYDRCVECRTTDRPHRALGLCDRCYGRHNDEKRRLAGRQTNASPARPVDDGVMRCHRCAAEVTPGQACCECARRTKLRSRGAL